MARQHIGYCPQFDALFNNMTVREHLEFYAHIKGVISSRREAVIEKQIAEMGLDKYRNTYANTLSGGNKRKLSVAMAMIGNPPIVFLDEPSTGMDPKAKRSMWNIISRISTLRQRSAVILTTHSMEEAEALSTKLGIMAEGQFKCFGSTQHIKSKYGEGFEIEITLEIPSSEQIMEILKQKGYNFGYMVNHENVMEVLNAFQAQKLNIELRYGGLGDHAIKEFDKGGMSIRNFAEFVMVEKPGLSLLHKLAHDFEHIILIEHYGNSYRVKLPKCERSLGQLFGKFEDQYKEAYNINQYSITQTSLEHIFNSFAKDLYKNTQNYREFKDTASNASIQE